MVWESWCEIVLSWTTAAVFINHIDISISKTSIFIEEKKSTFLYFQGRFLHVLSSIVKKNTLKFFLAVQDVWGWTTSHMTHFSEKKQNKKRLPSPVLKVHTRTIAKQKIFTTLVFFSYILWDKCFKHDWLFKSVDLMFHDCESHSKSFKPHPGRRV